MMELKGEGYNVGFFDAEGTIGIAKRRVPRSPNPQYRVQLSMGNTCFEVIREFKRDYGGHTGEERKEGRKPILRWYLSGIHAANLIHKWQPLLKVHREQAKLALEFDSFRRRSVLRGRRTSSEVVAELERFFQRMKVLNEVGTRRRWSVQETFPL